MPDTTPNRGYRIPKSDGTDIIQPDDVRVPLTSVDTDMQTIYGPWTSYNPVLTSTGTAPTLGTGGSAVGRFIQIGKTVTVSGTIKFGTGANFGTGNYSISLPVAASAAIAGTLGQVVVYPGSGGLWAVGWAVSNGSTFTPYVTLSASGAGTTSLGGSGTPLGVAWAANGEIRFDLTYEAA